MWSKPVIVVPPSAEPITLAQAKQFLRIDPSEDSFNTEIGIHVSGARGFIETVTSTRLAVQTVDLFADTFADLLHLSVGPANSIVSLEYVATDGEWQTIELDQIELVGTGLEKGIRRTDGTKWPSLKPRTGGALKLRLTVGYELSGDPLPDAIRTALLLKMRALFEGSEADIDHWLVNDRIWS